MELLMDCAFVPLPGIVDRSEFTSDFSLQLQLLFVYASMPLVYVIIHFTQVTLLTLRVQIV